MKAPVSPALTRSFWPSLMVSAVCGALFGGGAAFLYTHTSSHSVSSVALWGVNHLTSGTWLWAVAATLLSTAIMRHHPSLGWRRYAWAFVSCLAFLSLTTVLWYGFVIPPTQLAFLIFGAPIVCSIPSAGIALVSAYANSPHRVGLVARLCFPLGLTLILLAAPPPPLSYGGNAYAANLVWWTLMVFHALFACAILTHYVVSARTPNQNMTR